MDAIRFDRIAKTMVTTGSRRRVLGGLLSGLLARLGQEAAGATHNGCRHNGAACTRPGQCCSARCAGNGTCQPCTNASQCPAPPVSEPCKKRVCTSTGKCVIKNRAANAACTSDDKECTDDVCNASGVCTHPNKANNSICSGGFCQSGACEACLTLKADCTDGVQCCQDAGQVACSPIGNFGQGQCCRQFGGACTTPGQFDECCGVVSSPTSGSLVFCAPDNTCGGTGAVCIVSSTCASGVCCDTFPGLVRVCCAAGQHCENSKCTG